jgi:hypothetical protein
VAISDRKRSWFKAMNVACLALAAALICLFIHTHWTSYRLVLPTTSAESWELQAHRGGIYIVQLDPERVSGAGVALWASEPSESAYVWVESHVARWRENILFGLGFVHGDGYTVTRLPIWFFVVTLLLFPIWWMLHPHRRPRRLFNQCTECGYDLRGSIDRCPECGHMFVGQRIVPPPAARSLKPGHIPRRPTGDTDKSAEPSSSSPATARGD